METQEELTEMMREEFRIKNEMRGEDAMREMEIE